MTEENADGLEAGDTETSAEEVLPGRRRDRDRTRRLLRVTPRLSARERAEVVAAVAALGMSVHPPMEALADATRLCGRAVQHLEGLVDEVNRCLR